MDIQNEDDLIMLVLVPALRQSVDVKDVALVAVRTLRVELENGSRWSLVVI